MSGIFTIVIWGSDQIEYPYDFTTNLHLRYGRLPPPQSSPTFPPPSPRVPVIWPRYVHLVRPRIRPTEGYVHTNGMINFAHCYLQVRDEWRSRHRYGARRQCFRAFWCASPHNRRKFTNPVLTSPFFSRRSRKQRRLSRPGTQRPIASANQLASPKVCCFARALV